MTGRSPPPPSCDVLIAGGGPCGLMLANELGRRGVATVLVDPKSATATSPQANATQARTMEHFRRLGFADEVRAAGLPPDHPTDVAYFTRFTRHELGRFRLPTAVEAQRIARTSSGSWSAAERPHRVSQKFVEAVLRAHAERLASVTVRFGCALAGFRDTGEAVTATLADVGTGDEHTITASYLFAADGPRSAVRRALGLSYGGEGEAARDFMGGRMLALHLEAPAFYDLCPHPRAWMYWAFNRDRRAFMAAVDGRGSFAFHTQLRADEAEDTIDDRAALGLVAEAAGSAIPARILARASWVAGRTLVASGFQRGRVLLGGDAVHLFTPTGGLGYNTAIEDAVNAGWKLAMVVRGAAPPALLASYEAERRPLALRNTALARRFADRVGLYRPSPALEEDGPAGVAARARAGDYLAQHAAAEFNIPGITLGGRYDGSPIIIGDGTPPPPDEPSVYVPSGVPGGRAPHVWLADGRALFDAFGFEWTLLRLGTRPPDGSDFAAAAARRGLALSIVTCADPIAQDLYEADLALIRPDQIIAWRGRTADADAVLARVTGRG